MFKKWISVFVSLVYLQSAFAQVLGDYRAVASGTWATIANWQTFNGTTWVAAAAAPNSTNNVITIQSPFVINISATLTADQIIIDPGATLQNTGGAAVTFTIANGAGVDLLVNGIYQESGTAAVAWTAGATWQMGANGTLIKTTNTSSNNWQSNYQGGIATIPSTSNWIIRRNTAVNIPISTTTPASGSVYPNLTLENNVAGTWTMPAASSFAGAAITATVKGNLDVGGTGTSTVDFLNSNTYANPVLVQGNMLIRTGNSVRNYGTGFEIQGDLTVNGTISYDANDARTLLFSGANNQSLAGTGTLNIYALTINKTSNGLTLNRAITIDNLLTFSNGILYSSAVNLPTINTLASVAGASNASFVSGPVRYIGASAFSFPVGKGSDYQALGISAAGAAVTFYTETFDGAVCVAGSGCDPSLVSWTSVSLGAEGGSANCFYVSCQENGNAAGACGTGCGSDQSLHVGNVSTSAAAAFFCPSGDCGASYDASSAGEVTNKRVESPVIDCSGRSNITMAFNYIENGQGTTDNATVWYYDGTSWAQIDDPAKTVLCAGQGTWTARAITLPSSADNNPNVKIGFVWKNNGDGVGSDPSFAVDDITLITNPLVDFTCEYFYYNPQTTFGTPMVPSLNHITTCEYWTLTRNAGTENKNVTLAFDGNSCGVTLLSDLSVAHWDGAIWQDEGNTATTGSTAAGTITSAVVTWFSPFTLSSVSSENPLPIQLLKFTAFYNGNDVDLNWETASEINNDFFTVERSVDGTQFSEIGRVDGAGNSDHFIPYHSKDRTPFMGQSYYRLKQTDFNGNYTYSNLAPILIQEEAFNVVNVYNQTAQNVLEITLSCLVNCMVTVDLYDMTGKKVVALKSIDLSNVSKVLLPIENLSNGIYMLNVSNGIKLISRKVKL